MSLARLILVFAQVLCRSADIESCVNSWHTYMHIYICRLQAFQLPLSTPNVTSHFILSFRLSLLVAEKGKFKLKIEIVLPTGNSDCDGHGDGSGDANATQLIDNA